MVALIPRWTNRLEQFLEWQFTVFADCRNHLPNPLCQLRKPQIPAEIDPEWQQIGKVPHCIFNPPVLAIDHAGANYQVILPAVTLEQNSHRNQIDDPLLRLRRLAQPFQSFGD